MRLNYNIKLLGEKDDLPFDLLLLADETIAVIEKYIYDSKVYVAILSGQTKPIAVFALYKISDAEVEIKNIAVAERYQGKNLGSHLINEIKEIAKKQEYVSVIVGTPDTGVREINFYERNGFAKYDVKRNFFLEHYPEPIFNNGVVLKDMVMLKMQL